MKCNPLMAIDFYKADHKAQYPEGTTEVYSNFTPRSAKISSMNIDRVVFFGLQYFIIDFLQESWTREFFHRPKDEVLYEYKLRMDNSLGVNAIDISHISDLHDLGFLPLEIKALQEGELVPIGVPCLTVKNSMPTFFWLTNYIESVLSCYLWQPMTSATIAREFKKILVKYEKDTVGKPTGFVDFQAHDFSFRGMSSLESAAASSAGHLLSFLGTDTVSSIDFLEKYYGADQTSEVIGVSVPATEHSVMCMGTEHSETETFRRLISEIYPRGIVSIVSDTWDFWRVVTDYCRELKTEILARDGQVVIRPDSGDPVKIICGDPEAVQGSPESKGAIQCLWEIFGGEISEKGYKILDEHIGLIYGDSITIDRTKKIMSGLKDKGFASCNVVLGVGSYTYQYNTRDTFGFAMKATSGVVNGERRDIYKSPKTDGGTKKSAKGLLRVERVWDSFVLHQEQTEDQEMGGALEPVFKNGKILRKQSLADIRKKLL